MSFTSFVANRVGRIVGSERHIADLAGAIVGSQMVNGVIGVLFWMLAAHGLAKPELGTLGAATAAMNMIGALGTLGIGQLLISELPQTSGHHRWALFVVGLGISGLATALIGALFSAVAATTGESWQPLAVPGLNWWLMVAGAGLSGVSWVLDQVMLVIGNPHNQVVRNLLASAWKVLVIGVFMVAHVDNVTVGLCAWVSGLALGAVVAVRAATRELYVPGHFSPAFAWGFIRRYSTKAIGHHGINVGLAASSLVMPAVIASIVPAAENGVYTTVRLATMFGFMVPYALSVSLFAASAGEGTVDVGRSHRVLIASLVLSLTLYAAMFALAGPVLWLFGRGYAEEGIVLLRIMGMAGPLLVFKDQFIAEARLSRQASKVLPLLVVSSSLEIGLSLIGALRWGLRGAVIGWVVALAIQAVYLAPRLPWRTARTSKAASGAAGSAASGDLKARADNG